MDSVAVEQEPSIVGALLKAVNARLTGYFDERRNAQRFELVKSWNDDDTYPYKNDPGSEEEKVEQATFDVVSTAIHRHVTKKKGTTAPDARATQGLAASAPSIFSQPCAS